MHRRPPYVLDPGHAVHVRQTRLGDRIDYFYICINQNFDMFFIATNEQPFHKEFVQMSRGDFTTYERSYFPATLYIEINAVCSSKGVEFRDAMNDRNPIVILTPHAKKRLAEAVSRTKALPVSVKDVICDRLQSGSDVIPYHKDDGPD